MSTGTLAPPDTPRSPTPAPATAGPATTPSSEAEDERSAPGKHAKKSKVLPYLQLLERLAQHKVRHFTTAVVTIFALLAVRAVIKLLWALGKRSFRLLRLRRRLEEKLARSMRELPLLRRIASAIRTRVKILRYAGKVLPYFVAWLRRRTWAAVQLSVTSLRARASNWWEYRKARAFAWIGYRGDRAKTRLENLDRRSDAISSGEAERARALKEDLREDLKKQKDVHRQNAKGMKDGLRERQAPIRVAAEAASEEMGKAMWGAMRLDVLPNWAPAGVTPRQFSRMLWRESVRAERSEISAAGNARLISEYRRSEPYIGTKLANEAARIGKRLR